MKTLLLLIAIIGMVSCKKTDSGNQDPQLLNGKWRMVTVKDNASGRTNTKPATEQGNVDITFTVTSNTNGTFKGVTPSNDIWQNDYSTGASQAITIPVLSMTKVGETSWGLEFVDNIRTSQQYSFDNNGRLSIRTTNKTLVFQRL